MTLDRTIERTAIPMLPAYGRCRECGHLQRDPAQPCEAGCEGNTVEFVEGRGIPPGRAWAKAEGTTAGKFAVYVGMLLCVAAAVLAGLIVLQGSDLTLVAGAVIGVIGALGFVLFGIGMSLVSRDAEPAIGAAGEWLVKLVRAVRGKNGV